VKLLFCTCCKEVYSLRREVRYCSCGRTWGQYEDNLNAVYSGPAIPLGFNNTSFQQALQQQPEDFAPAGKTFEAFVIASECDTFRKRK